MTAVERFLRQMRVCLWVTFFVMAAIGQHLALIFTGVCLLGMYWADVITARRDRD